MSLIEKAVERLTQLKQAGAMPEPEYADDAIAPAAGVAAEPAAPRVERIVAGPHARDMAQRGAPGARTVELDLARLTLTGMVTPDLPRSVIAEEYRVIKRPLIHNAQGKGAGAIANGNLIMITSALPAEGKSFTAVNLAMSIAMELDHTVLLVDADFSRPSILAKLGLPPHKGLMDVLVGEVADLSDVLLRTNVEKLSILPAGMPHQRATELIASDAMNRMLDDMASRYAERIIVFDSPPLLATTEARVLASHMGQVVVVVESDRTTHGTVKQALSTIEACPVKLLILNKATEGGRGNLYGYGYGYGYGANSRTEAAL
jgi:receptor protein-tyrosine kinase